MSRSSFAVLGLCVAFVACGEKFVARAGSGGASNGGRSGANNSAGEAGEPAGGSAGETDAAAGEAGADTGGFGGSEIQGGTGGLLGSVGGGGVGGLLEPMLSRDGLLIRLRADRGIQQKDGFVEAWQDQSGNQANARQTSANVRPAYLAAGFNGRPTLEFDGQGQFLTFTAGFSDFSEGLTGFIVAKPSKSECASMLEFSNGSEKDDVAMAMWQNKWTYEVTELLIHTGSVNLSAFSLYSVTHRPAGSADLRINGNLLQTLDMPVPASVVREENFVGHTLYTGGCEYFRGQISEIILYSRALASAERVLIEQYLDAHWAL